MKHAYCLLMMAIPAEAYYGGRAAEATLRFRGVADVPFENVQLATLNEPGRFRSKAREWVDSQIQHLMGTFQSESFFREFKGRGVIGETYELKFVSVEDGSAAGRKKLGYEFTGKVVFDKSRFGSDRKARVPIKLPLAPDLVYAESSRDGVNPCTDEHYNSEDDFWYFWDPDQRGCPLAGDSERVFRTTGTAERIDKLKKPTYPEYDRLLGDNGNGPVTDIRVFFGYIDEDKPQFKPNRRDDAFRAMREMEADLKKNGFRMTEEEVGFRETETGRIKDGSAIYRVWEREQKFKIVREGPVKVRVAVLLADTSIGADSRPSKPDFTFHHYLIPALKDADVVLYDGHSGLGANLDIKGIDPRFRFDKDKYQIMFFNGCSTYPYFNGMYIEKKGGTKSLEVITTGLPTLSNTSAPNMLAVMNALVDGKFRTYQTIMRALEKSNKKEGTYLSAVSGDEDNRWRP